MPLFEVAVLLKPTQKEEDEGRLEEIILAPRNIIAKDEQSASFQIIADNVDEFKDIDKARLEVRVRPF